MIITSKFYREVYRIIESFYFCSYEFENIDLEYSFLFLHLDASPLHVHVLQSIVKKYDFNFYGVAILQ